MERGSFQSKKDVQEYLIDNYLIKIYEELNEGGDYQNLFDPLEFFNLLYEYRYIIYQNYQRPLDIVNHIKGLDLDKHQLHFFLKKLMGSFNHKSFPLHRDLGRKNENDKICLKFIRKEWKNLDDELFKKDEPEIQKEEKTDELHSHEKEFQRVREHSDTLEKLEDRIQYINKAKIRYMQSNWSNFNRDNPTNNIFIYNCELEIERLKEIQSTENKNSVNTSNTPLGQYTNSQVVLIFHYFFKYSGFELRKNIDIAPIAKFIHLLTGKVLKNNIDSSDYYKKLKSNSPHFKSDKELKNDLMTIKLLFQQVQLSEIVKMIDYEIDSCDH